MTGFPLRPFASVVLASFAMAACTPTVPEAGGGVGFQDYNSYIRSAPPAPLPGGPVVVPPVGGAFDPAAAAAAIDRADGVAPAAGQPAGQPVVIGDTTPDVVALDPNRPRGNAPAGIKEESGEMVHNNTGISDEQDFEAVKSRESIESDKERIARNRSEYVLVQPTDLPQRPGDTGPNIVEYALATTHAPGVQLHQRRGNRDPAGPCAKFTSPDKAQTEFLRTGGPERDKLGVDPDGDGFACSWDPRPFRTALQ